MKMSRGELGERIFLLLCVGVIWPSVFGWHATWIRILQLVVLVILVVMAVRKIIRWGRL